MLGLLVLIAAPYGPVSGDDVTLSLELSTSVAEEGQNLTAVCTISNIGSPRPLLLWIRKLPADGQEIEIATNHHIDDRFIRSGRYVGHQDTSDVDSLKTIRYTLVISNLQVADNGDIVCRIPGESGEVRKEVIKSFVVWVPIKKVQWRAKHVGSIAVHQYTDGQIVSYREHDLTEFTCQVSGSYPEPEVNVFLDTQNITTNFTRYVKLDIGSEQRGLKSLFYNVILVQTFNVSFDFDAKRLRCVANLKATNNSLGIVDQKEMSASVNISLSEYKPQFLCPSVRTVKLGEPYYPLTCTVRALPHVDT